MTKTAKLSPTTQIGTKSTVNWFIRAHQICCFLCFSFSCAIGTPDNVNGDENCMLLIYDGNSNSVFWNDGTCHMPLNYICETEDT